MEKEEENVNSYEERLTVENMNFVKSNSINKLTMEERRKIRRRELLEKIKMLEQILNETQDDLEIDIKKK